MRLVQNYPDPTLWYYYRGPVGHLVLPPGPLDATGATREVTWLVAADVRRAILVEQPSPGWDPGGLAADALGAAYRRIAATRVDDWPIQIFAAPADDLPAAQIAFANGLRLEGAQVLPEQVIPGSVVEVQLAWNAADATLRGSEQVSIQLLDADGRLVGQTDRPLGQFDAQAKLTAGYGILAPNNAAGGDLTVTLVVYDAGAPALPRLLTTDGADATPLATVRLVPAR